MKTIAKIASVRKTGIRPRPGVRRSASPVGRCASTGRGTDDLVRRERRCVVNNGLWSAVRWRAYRRRTRARGWSVLENCCQLRGIDGFDEVGIEPGGQATLPVFRAPVAGQRDQLPRLVGLGTDLPR